jgi:hypothetical protein
MKKVYVLARDDEGNAYLVFCPLATAKAICARGGANRILGSVKITGAMTQEKLEEEYLKILAKHRMFGGVSASSSYWELASSLPGKAVAAQSEENAKAIHALMDQRT